MQMTYKLKFKNHKGDIQQVCDIQCDDSTEDIMVKAMEEIKKYCHEHGHHMEHYIRAWNSDGDTVFDFGSHTDFFHLTPQIYSITMDHTEIEDKEL